MERLTERCADGKAYLCGRGIYNYEQVVNRLAEYEDAEEEGLLVRLPCKVGDTVYRPLYGKIWEGIVLNFCFDGTASASVQNVAGGAIVFEHKEDFGKTVFLTCEEAEAALKGDGEDVR